MSYDVPLTRDIHLGTGTAPRFEPRQRRVLTLIR
jgi:hypothetical protein